METERKKYLINNKEYYFKERYSLKDWGGIIEIITSPNSLENKDEINLVIHLLKEDNIIKLLNLIFTEPIEGEIYEDDFEEVTNAINDFMMRKKNSMINLKNPLQS
mgnify:CR=1 FL=1